MVLPGVNFSSTPIGNWLFVDQWASNFPSPDFGTQRGEELGLIYLLDELFLPALRQQWHQKAEQNQHQHQAVGDGQAALIGDQTQQ